MPAFPATSPALQGVDQQLCFALYRATHAITRQYRALMQPLGISYTQYLVLLALWEQDGLTLNGLCTRLDLDPGSLSPVLARMESRGWLRRERDDHDGRSVRAVLTGTGMNLRRAVAPLQQEVARRVGLQAEDFISLHQRLHDLADRLDSGATAV